MDAQLIQNLQEKHLAVWNERDKTKRHELIITIYSDNIRMYDPNITLHGIEEISDFIDKVQADPKFNFVATKPMDSAANGVRLFWSITTEQGLLTGMDFFIVEEGKVMHLYVFIDALAV